MWDRTNGPIVRTSFVIANSSGAPSASGQVSLWALSGAMQLSTPLSGSLNLGDPLTRLGLGFTDTVTTPFASGRGGIWENSGYVQVRTPTAADIVLGTQVISVTAALTAMASGNSFRVQPGFACQAQALDFVVGQAPGNSGNALIQLGVGASSVSGGALTFAYPSMSAGARIAGTAITGNAAIGTSGEFTFNVVSALSGAFGAGLGTFVLRVGPPA